MYLQVWLHPLRHEKYLLRLVLLWQCICMEYAAILQVKCIYKKVLLLQTCWKLFQKRITKYYSWKNERKCVIIYRENKKYRAWAEIDINAAAKNMKNIRAITNKNARIMATVKADAYGHGFLEMSKIFLGNGADRLAVATLDEAIQLRREGIDVPIMILGASDVEDVEELVEFNIIPAVFDVEFAKELSKAATKKKKTAKIHIKVDTGMSRIGFVVADENDAIIDEIISISKLPNIEIEGIFSHLSTSDEADDTYTRLQFERFMSVVNNLSEKGLDIPIKHICNSAAIIMYPEMHLDMVRPGIILYGLYPSDDINKSKLPLKPVMTLKSRITLIKEVEADRGVSYGKEYITDKKTRIATVSIGYADGYIRKYANQGEVLLESGEKAPIIGRICMDQCMIDVTNVHNIHKGDEVILFGDEGVSADDAAKRLDTINYEITCMVSKRIPRVYIKNERTVKTLNYLV